VIKTELNKISIHFWWNRFVDVEQVNFKPRVKEEKITDVPIV